MGTYQTFKHQITATHKVDTSRNMLDYQVAMKEEKTPLKLVFKKKFHCQYCDYFAENSEKFEIHQGSHINRRLHQCGHGEKVFAQKTKMVNHVKNNLLNYEKTNLVNHVKNNFGKLRKQIL